MIQSPLSSHPHLSSPQLPDGEDESPHGMGIGSERGPPITINELVQVGNPVFFGLNLFPKLTIVCGFSSRTILSRRQLWHHSRGPCHTCGNRGAVFVVVALFTSLSNTISVTLKSVLTIDN